MGENEFCYVQFKYECLIAEGEEVRIVGNKEELGNWDFNQAEKLSISNINVWKSRENIEIPINTTVEYKYVIFKNDKFERWEELPNNENRKVFIENKFKVLVIDKQGDSNSKIQEVKTRRKNTTPTPALLKGKLLPSNNQLSKETESPYYKRASINQEEIISDDEEEINVKFNNLNYESSEDEEEIHRKNTIKSSKTIEINDSDDIIILSFYVPFNPVKKNDGSYYLRLSSDPFYHTLFRLVEGKKNIKWFGMLKNINFLNEEQQKTLIDELKEKNIYVMNIPKEIYDDIKIFFEEILEPLFHYISISPNSINHFSHFDLYWESFKKYSECVCDIIQNYLKNNTLIYLNDYHFFLLPSYLYSKCATMNQTIFQHLSIGLFMHTPFPSHEIFKKIPFREEIIKSLLNCSVIGFHTFDYSRNFLKSSKRLLSVDYESTISGDLAVNYYGRTAMIRVKNATPEISLIKEDFETEEFKKLYEGIKNKYKDKTIYASLDHMKFLASIKNKLEGYRKFLYDMGENAKKNVYLQYIRYSTDDSDKDGNLKLDESQKEILEKINNLAKEIKETFGEDTIELVQRKVSYIERLALFASANCFIRTSKQESFSLGIYEFLILKDLLKDTNKVSYIISELSGVNTSLGGTIKINPFDYNSIYNGFIQADQNMYGERDEKDYISSQKDFEHVKKSSFKNWLFKFLKDIKNTKLSDENTYYLGVGEGLNFKLMKIHSNFVQFNIEKIIPIYNESNHRLIFLDYEGTLPSSSIDKNNDDLISKGNQPTEEILNLLSDLTKDKRNQIYIITGRGTHLVNKWFGKIKDLYLAAEHGFVYKMNSGKGNDKWKRMIKHYNNGWINACHEIMNPYIERCEGSFIEIKESSIVWQYSDCDQELGKSFASVITNELECSVKKLNLKIVNGKGYVEVIARGVNKAYFISHIIKDYLNKEIVPDFIMCIGDDTSDEKMFSYLKNKKKIIKDEYSKNLKVITCTVGKKPSSAHYYVNNPKEVRNIIETFAKLSHKLPSIGSQENVKIKKEFEEIKEN